MTDTKYYYLRANKQGEIYDNKSRKSLSALTRDEKDVNKIVKGENFNKRKTDKREVFADDTDGYIFVQTSNPAEMDDRDKKVADKLGNNGYEYTLLASDTPDGELETLIDGKTFMSADAMIETFENDTETKKSDENHNNDNNVDLSGGNSNSLDDDNDSSLDDSDNSLDDNDGSLDDGDLLDDSDNDLLDDVDDVDDGDLLDDSDDTQLPVVETNETYQPEPQPEYQPQQPIDDLDSDDINNIKSEYFNDLIAKSGIDDYLNTINSLVASPGAQTLYEQIQSIVRTGVVKIKNEFENDFDKFYEIVNQEIEAETSLDPDATNEYAKELDRVQYEYKTSLKQSSGVIAEKQQAITDEFEKQAKAYGEQARLEAIERFKTENSDRLQTQIAQVATDVTNQIEQILTHNEQIIYQDVNIERNEMIKNAPSKTIEHMNNQSDVQTKLNKLASSIRKTNNLTIYKIKQANKEHLDAEREKAEKAEKVKQQKEIYRIKREEYNRAKEIELEHEREKTKRLAKQLDETKRDSENAIAKSNQLNEQRIQEFISSQRRIDTERQMTMANPQPQTPNAPKKPKTGLIVTSSILGTVLVLGGLFGGYTAYENSKNRIDNTRAELTTEIKNNNKNTAELIKSQKDLSDSVKALSEKADKTAKKTDDLTDDVAKIQTATANQNEALNQQQAQINRIANR